MEAEILKPRHSLSHILAQAVQRSVDPIAKLGIGPAIDTGFYYDFIFSDGVEFKEEHLKELNKMMVKIVKESQLFHRIDLNYTQAKEMIDMLGEGFKLELLDEFKAAGETVFSYYINTIPLTAKDNLLKWSKEEYITKYEKINDYMRSLNLLPSTFNLERDFITFIDMCEGPHVDTTKEINPDAFKLDKIAGAYWRGNEKNPMMTRIYGLAFENKDALKTYVEMLEEAKKRDHRVLGKKLWLFVFSELVGPGLPLYTYKGNIIRKEIIKYSNELQTGIWYQEVHTPNMNKAELFKISWHYEKYKEDMMRVVSNYSDEEYFLKPMNCPQHTQIYAAEQRSYTQMPIRISDFANLYRDERPGELNGLSRLRCFCQDDGHCFCREDQIKQEFLSVLWIIQKALNTYGMASYSIRLSLRDPNKREKYLWEPETREKSQKLLEEILIENNIDYIRAEGEAAIYGPKMDIVMKDSLGRERQISTIQLDFIMPQRFKLAYINSEGKEITPVMIHRAIIWSPERFMSILIEHYAWAFPLRLAPEQIKIIPVAEPFIAYAKEVNATLLAQNLRSSIDESDDSFSKKIRNAEIQKIPYIIIVGEKEESTKTLSIREYRSKKQYEISNTEFVDKCLLEIKNRSL